MKFVALDVETANADMASICSVGLAVYEMGILTEQHYTLVDPQDTFDGMNVSIHGINEEAVLGAPTFADLSNDIQHLLRDSIVVHHTHFDRVSIQQAATRWGVAPPTYSWLDTAKVARRIWADCARRGYGLRSVCDKIGYHFKHHHALEDAKASANVLLAAMSVSGLDLAGMLQLVQTRVSSSRGSAVKRDGDPNGPLCGEVMVFTGTLSMTRLEAAKVAAKLGCTVDDNVTKKTTLLVVGGANADRFGLYQKSSKHRKAEFLVAKGYQVRIIREADFHKLGGTP